MRPSFAKPRRVGGEGEIEVFTADEQHDVVVDIARWQRLAVNVLTAEGVRGNTELTLIFVDERTMTELNAQYMGNSYPTDVLSFPLDAVEAVRTPGPGAMSKSPDHQPLDMSDHPLLLGDVVVHGILHVLGNDHDTPSAEAAMHAREKLHLESLHWGHETPAEFRHIQKEPS